MQELRDIIDMWILFNGQIKNEKAIIKISDLSELKLIDKGRMHLFDEEILPVLPAIEYCLPYAKNRIGYI